MNKQEIKNIIENNISNIGNQAPWGAALSKVLNELVDMPSMTQQDYLRLSGKGMNDCHLLAAIMHNLLHGTLFDTILRYNSPGGNELDYSRIIGLDATNNRIFFCDPSANEVASYEMYYTQTQYEGLAAIQDAEGDYSIIPSTGEGEGFLTETSLGLGYIGVEGKKLSVSVKDGKIAALTISNESGSDLDISWEDAQKLIGLPIIN